MIAAENQKAAVAYCSVHDMPMLKDSDRCPIGRIEDATEHALQEIDEAGAIARE
jgi:hypothetical protein